MKFLRFLAMFALGLLGLGIVLLIAVILINTKDEALRPDVAARLLRTPPPDDGSGTNGAYLIWAFDAPAGIDATPLGRAVFEALAAVPAERVAQNDWSIHPLYKPEAFDFPIALACVDPNSACIDKALAQPDVIRQLVIERAGLFARLASIDRAEHWGFVPVLDAANAPLPPVRPLIGLYSLSLDQAAVEIHEHHTAEGAARLEADVRIARRLLASSSSALMKSVSTDLLRRAMLAYSEILRAERADPATVAAVAASLERSAVDFSPAERNLGVVFDTEARRAHSLALQVAHPANSAEGSFLERLATRAAPLFFKPEATSNLAGELFQIEAPLADSTPAGFLGQEDAIRSAFAKRADEIGHVGWSTPYNPLGRIMAGYVPDLVDYAARIHDDAALMRAVRVQAWLMSRPVHFAGVEDALAGSPQSLWDPYRERPFAWRKADSGIAVTQHSSRGVPLIAVPLS